MADLKAVKTIIFDYDGTLHDSSAIYIPAFKRAYDYLVAHNKAEPKIWTDEEITQWLGYSKQDMWQQFMPELDELFQTNASNLIGETLQSKIHNNEARLYPDAVETLSYLKEKGYTLLFLSNCSIDYMNLHAEKFKLDQYFSKLFCTEMFNFKKSKKEIMKIVKQDYEGDFLIVGDRFQDIEVAELDNTYSIGCTYGFGQKEELEPSDVLIHTISDLKTIL